MTFLGVTAVLAAVCGFWPNCPPEFAIGLGAALFAITPIISALAQER